MRLATWHYPSNWPTHLEHDVKGKLYKYSLFRDLCRCSWSGSLPLYRGRFCLCVWGRISQELPSATLLSERASTVSHMFCFNRLYLDCWDGWGYLYQYIIIYSQITDRQSQVTVWKKINLCTNEKWECASEAHQCRPIKGRICDVCGAQLSFSFKVTVPINCRYKVIKYWSERDVVAVTPYLLSVFLWERFADKASFSSKRLAKRDLHNSRPHDHMFIYTASGVTLKCELAVARC